MGNPTIFYYPDSSGTLEEIDLVDVSDIEVSTERFRSDAQGVTGRLSITDYGTRHVVRIVRARFAGLTTAGEDLVAELTTLQNHLQRGGSCGFAFDKDKAWAGFLRSRKKRGDTVLKTHGNVFYNSAAALVANDRVYLQSANPEGRIEGPSRISTQVGDVITLAAGLKGKYENLPVLVRHRDFYPTLRMPSGAVDSPIITTDQRMNYTLDMNLVEDVDSMFKFAGYGGTLTGTTGASGTRSKSIEQVIGSIRDVGTLPGSTTLNRS